MCCTDFILEDLRLVSLLSILCSVQVNSIMSNSLDFILIFAKSVSRNKLVNWLYFNKGGNEHDFVVFFFFLNSKFKIVLITSSSSSSSFL